MIRCLAVAMAVLVANCAALAQDFAELEVDQSVATEFVTPHTKWAQPYALGKTQALFFVRGHGTAPREVIELKQRFDVEPEMVFWARVVDSTKEGWHGASNGVQRMMRLLGQKWDAFVFLGTPPERMPTEAQYLMVKQIAQGAGLVLSGVRDERICKDKNRIETLPPFLATGPVGEAFSILEGRAILLPAQPEIEYALGWEMEYDIWQLRLGKALLWAAGKEPQVSLSLERRAAEVHRAALPSDQVTVRWETPGWVPNLVFDVTLRRGDGWKMSLPRIAARAAAGSASVELPVVRAGDYRVDVIGRSERGIEASDSLALAVTSSRQVVEVTLDRNWGEVGEQFTGTAMLAGDPLGADERLLVSLFDRRGRELLREDLGPPATEATFSFPIAAGLPMLVRVQATLTQADQEVASAYQFARVTKRHRGQFNFVIWDCPRGTLAPYGEEALARSGVTCQLTHGTPPLFVAANDISWIPYTTRILTHKDEGGVMKPACWNDEAGIQAHVDGIVSAHQASREHGVFVYSLGDEGAVRGSCLSPHCLEAYRQYLRQQYGTIQALNASWDTDFAGFEDVQLSQPDDNDEAEAFRAGNFPRWYDRQAYQSYNFCKLCERFGESFRELDPMSRCGFEGAGRFQDGDDLDGFIRSNTFWSPYPGTADEVVRSVAPRDFPRSNWMGYTKDADTLLVKYWRMITRGCDAVWWWRWDCIGRFHGWISPSLDPYPAVKEILADTRVVRQGLGDLLLHCEMLDDGVGMLFSQPSAYAAKVQMSPSYGSYEGDHVAWHNNLRDLGLQFRYVTDRQLRLGEFRPDEFKVMIIPFIQALGPREAELLTQFVRDGGTLIADLRPALYGGHCKPLAAGLLDELFGVQSNGGSEAVVVDGLVRLPTDGNTIEAALPGLKVDPGVQTAGATVLGQAGETPLLLINEVGEGRAILLNFAMSSYPVLAVSGTDESAADLLGAMLGMAGVRPALSVLDAGGKRLRNVELTRWRNGRYEIVSVFRYHGAAEPARIVFDRDVQLHDLKARRDLGHGRSFPLAITPYRAQMLVVTNRKAPAVEVATGQDTVSRGELLTGSVTVPRSRGLHAVKLQVTMPDGAPAQWLDQVILTDRKGAQVVLPVAFNDPTGVWRVNATDLLPSPTATCQFTVK